MSNQTLTVQYVAWYPQVNKCAKLPHLRPSQFCPMPGMFVEVSGGGVKEGIFEDIVKDFKEI